MYYNLIPLMNKVPPAVFTVATGGTITTVGDYKIHTFNSSNNFVVSQLGTAPFNVVEYLVVAGGAGGGGELVGGGGGAGGLLTSTGLSIAVQTYSVVVGSGVGGSASRSGTTGSISTESSNS